MTILTQQEIRKINFSNHLAVVQAFIDGKHIQYRTREGEPWLDAPNPQFNFGYAQYRIKPESPDVIPWPYVDSKYNWYARDDNGDAWFYSVKPVIRDFSWKLPYGSENKEAPLLFKNAGALAIKVGNCNWRQSLQSRMGD